MYDSVDSEIGSPFPSMFDTLRDLRDWIAPPSRVDWRDDPVAVELAERLAESERGN